MKVFINLPYEVADAICQMEAICYSEGQGPYIPELFNWIAEHYPELKEKYKHLPVFSGDK